jgi:CBS domain-containing protein
VGTINHPLMSLEVLRARGARVLSVIVSRPPTEAVRHAIASFGRVDVLDFPVVPAPDATSLEDAVVGWLARDDVRRMVDAVGARRTRVPSADLATRDAAVVWHPYTQHATAAPPLPVASARGAHLRLADGTSILDGISSWWTTLHGHGHPAIAAAIARQAATLDHVLFAGSTHAPAVTLAERLVALAPDGLERVFYADDGSTAVEAAIKMALAFHRRRGMPGRDRLLGLVEGYHGDTAGAMSVSDDGPFVRDFGALRVPVMRVAPAVPPADDIPPALPPPDAEPPPVGACVSTTS